MKLTNLGTRSAHTISMTVSDGPILPPPQGRFGRPMKRQVTRIAAKTTDTMLDETTQYTLTIGYIYLKKDGNPAQWGGISFIYDPDQEYPDGVHELVEMFLGELATSWSIKLAQIEPPSKWDRRYE